MTTRHALPLGLLLATTLLLVFAPHARAELVAWDQARVREISTELVTATDALYETFRKQAPPDIASMHANAHHELKQFVRLLRIEARELARSLEDGEGREPTLPLYRNLMQLARSARDHAARVFVTRDVGDRAAAVRRVLNELGPYYDPDFPPLVPHPNIESGAVR
jgi:hypothetical protein